VSDSISSTESGGKNYDGVYLSWNMDEYMYGQYKIYRSTSATSGYKLIGTVENYNSWGNYTDTTATIGKTYYYKVCLVRGTDSYVKTDKILKKTAAKKITTGKLDFHTYFSLSYTTEGVEITNNAYSYSGNYYYIAANQFDVYRSTKPSSGFKKIKTAYASSVVDKTVKAGKVYYYKIVPKVYIKNINKVITGTKSAVKGVKTLLGSSMNIEVEQVSATAAKVSWDKVAGANVYEVWVKNNNISGDVYKKVATTKSLSATIKGLSATGEYYAFKVYAQKKTKGIVKYQNSDYTTHVIGYTDSVHNVQVVSATSKLSSDKKTVAVYNRITWDKDWGASGYIITAYNRYTDKVETIKKITSAKTTSYVFRNPISAAKGQKYNNVYITPYKGSKKGDETYVDLCTLGTVKNVKVKKVDGNTVKVTWTKVSGATDYYVYRRSLNYNDSTYVGSTSSNSIEDTAFSTGDTYTYYVSASGSLSSGDNWTNLYGLDSDDSNEYTHKLTTPTIKSIKNSASKTVTLKWGSIGKADYYIIYRSTSKSGKYTRVGAVTTGNLTYTDKKLTKGKTYYYKVVAKSIGAGGSSTLSKASTAKGIKVSK
jgi:fibronectin type 3 domain-containing protein